MFGIFGGFLCLPIASLLGALFVMWACKILKEQRDYMTAYKAAITLGGVMTLVNIPFRFLDINPFVLLSIHLVIAAGVGATVYANLLELEIGKAFCVWLLQGVMTFAFCMAIVLPLVMATVGLGTLTAAMFGNEQVAQGPALSDDDDEEAVDDEEASQDSEESAEDSMEALDGEPSEEMSSESSEEPSEEMPSEEPSEEMPAEGESEPPPDDSNSEPESPDGSEPPPDDGTEPEPPEPMFAPGLQGDAQRAFHEGRLHEGRQFLMAALVAGDDETMWKNVRWCKALQQPVMGLNWGIALQMAGPPPQIPGDENGGDPAAAVPPDDGNEPGEGDGGRMLPDEDLSQLRKYTGEIGPRLMEKLPQANLDGLLGQLPPDSPRPRSVQFVGVGADTPEVLSLARQKDVDALVICAISFRIYGLNRTIDASLVVRVMDVVDEERLWSSKTLSSNRVKADIARGKDPIKDLVSSLEEYLEHDFHLSDRPDVTSEQLRQTLAAWEPPAESNPLPRLLALRYYQRQRLLSAADAKTHYQKLLDESGAAAMASGTPDERRQAIERFLPRTQ